MSGAPAYTKQTWDDSLRAMGLNPDYVLKNSPIGTNARWDIENNQAGVLVDPVTGITYQPGDIIPEDVRDRVVPLSNSAGPVAGTNSQGTFNALGNMPASWKGLQTNIAGLGADTGIPIAANTGLGGTDMPELPATDLVGEETYGPFAAYMARLGLGGRQALNPAEQYRGGQYGPLKSIFDVLTRMATAVPSFAPSTGEFANWALPNVGANLYSQAANALRGIFGLTPEQRAGSSTEFQDNNVTELKNFLLSGLAPKLGLTTANWLAGKVPSEQQRWLNTQAMGQDTNTSFLDWFRKQYNLQALGY